MPKFFTCLSSKYPMYGFPFADDTMLNNDLPPIVEVPKFGLHQECSMTDDIIYAAYLVQKDDGIWDIDASKFGIIGDVRVSHCDLRAYGMEYMYGIEFFLITHNGIAIPIEIERADAPEPFEYLSPQDFGFASYPIREKKPVEWRNSLHEGEKLYDENE